MLLGVVALSFTLTTLASAESILMTEVFVIPIRPETFDWSEDARSDQFSYQPSLLNAPDLPSWIHYTYSKRDHHGFLYGVAPKDRKYFQLEIVGLNKHTYETRYKVLDMNVLEKENLTKYEVHLKIDNLNVEDMFDRNRTEELLDIFRKRLWKDATDLYVTFLASAVDLGARLPLKPSEGEGVVIRLGSSMPFSQELNELQEEVKPLWKLPSCPRDFKRTSVERLFREAEFALDWCSFRLVEQEQQSLQHESARRGPSVSVLDLPASGISEHSEWRWARSTKASIPTRSYLEEIATTIFVPTILLLVLAALLSTVLCLDREKLNDLESEEYFYELFNIFHDRKRGTSSEKRENSSGEGVSNNNIQMVQYAAIEIQYALKSLSAQPSSPNDSLLPSPRMSSERCNPYIRPNPPPYTGPSNLSGIRADF
ncbi:PREDICTED: epsilon-sarcoglycan isoform X1 [Eufriesea mexicana]|uniref:epsilon-sarcoglycan isoform X1 n=1 Tax=Eufriesea mexicana TaxID=516756 RepID=UPI00083BB32E|nr:PREDICTED: epsilon-sarcoglycan isoform X1 [Eufriesea mexicana]XP_017758122.1 PREDICTED: epsilon-sarcoglycan isoform X1 [Eufriesea mexicana]XP_017758123.1 PREDICTED: epsilon-sarcoglycan isoform X1 [Eufriesea mexicana]XP_017758124.1 PREDICTED: epsilon-sarcoglycan isoform X1 [Eufriesea mexicana]XP_017758125.1 PREDICTED: epsilon-sarcoglycan isoform X1 [Eufriesea mexicana]XP_017758127.1 PREDICTED: epsilon-sarcoglycan isoform X1 [Eufriesea mexicana]XP_017758128.1 PREDICTED: epsilon-sarcoglycan i